MRFAPCFSLLASGVSLLAFGLLAAPVAAHPLHISHAEADYNRDTGRLEVALKVFADDFESKLTVRTGHRISLEKTPAAELDALCLAELVATFTVKSRDGAPQPLHWVGRELKDAENHLWLYFEVALTGGAEGARIFHGVLGDFFRDQLNSVLVRDAGRAVTLVYFPDRAEKIVAFK